MLKSGTRRIYQSELTGLNRQYLKQRDQIAERCLTDIANQELVGNSSEGERVFDALPARLGYWQAKHAVQVRMTYPELSGAVAAIEALASRRTRLIDKRNSVTRV